MRFSQEQGLNIARQAPLFADLRPDQIDHVTRMLRPRAVADDQLIFLKGDACDGVYVVVEGRVRIVAQTSDGKEVVLNLIRPMDCFGELAVLDGSPRTASAYAQGETVLAVISGYDFHELLRNSPDFSLGVLRTLSARFRLLNEMLEATMLHSLSQRLAHTLLSLVTKDGISTKNSAHPVLSISQSDLALLVGASRVSVNKHLQVWKSDGALDIGRGAITIIDTEHLLNVLRT
ncbi:MAG: Crp/Fnr family transcriptional regulator [Henriciella sp.]|nr:Crp/Fnr family transcriptional regulator [Henriciella sp.]